ncbi:hypothetical protein B7P43_G11242 [Cryptotermes secundus]|uniref:Uncharacterized protein n=1 Tax=Cryptotermes secundus TaxID=105785 RepID=A0A2J7R0W7_9NEOP|nr:hypothetical protein B7P43_G11242 [Cryptotermes secundus]
MKERPVKRNANTELDPEALQRLSVGTCNQQRNASRQDRWREAPKDQGPALLPAASQLRFDSLHNKIQGLKSEIVSLIGQDMALFQQLFALQEAILELKDELEYCPSSSESSPYDSPCSTLSSLSSSESGSKCTKYKTARSSELRAILARAREKAEDTGSHLGSERSSGGGRQRPALQGIDPRQKPYTSSDNSSLGMGDDESDGDAGTLLVGGGGGGGGEVTPTSFLRLREVGSPSSSELKSES